MSDQLSVYNDALDQIGSRRLASLAEDREPKRALDAIWTDAVQYCLEQAMWTFALRTAALTLVTTPAIAYGFSNAFTRPTDVIYTYMLSPDGKFDEPNRDVLESDGFYFGRGTALFSRYTSNDASYGTNPVKWPATFAEYLSNYLASKVCFRLTRNLDLTMALGKQAMMTLGIARLKDAVMASVGTVAMNATARREYTAGGDLKEPFPFVPQQPQQKQQ